MALEDFERELAQSHTERKRSWSPDHRERSHRHHRNHHRSSRHDDETRHSHKRSRRYDDEERSSRRHKESRHGPSKGALDGIGNEVGENSADNPISAASGPTAHRDSWMQAPSTLEIDYVQRKEKKEPPSQHVRATQEDFKPSIHKNELNSYLRNPSEAQGTAEVEDEEDLGKDVDYVFGDSGAHWRMTKLKAVYRKVKDSGRPVDDVAKELYGNLKDFDNAREEETELDRRDTYGQGYLGKKKPTGDLYEERTKASSEMQANQEKEEPYETEDEFEAAQQASRKGLQAPASTVVLDQTALNKLKAQMMKAKLKRLPGAAQLEAEYNVAIAGAANRKQPDVVVINKIESRLLDRGKGGEVNSINNKRGRERGQVVENEDMSIEDMVRHERRTKGQYGGEGKAFAERIAKDAKFDNDLDYMDQNAAKLAKHVQKTDINLRNTAISDYQKTKHILDTCPLCHHEDTSTPPQAPLVSLATRVYLTLPTSPEITPYGLCASIVPIQHRLNLLECDDDEWEEIRNFMKSLSRFYFSQKPSYSVIFYENAAHDGRKRHASMEAVPIPLALGETAPAFFRESILAADEEWTQHKKLIDTQAKAKDGLGKFAVRRTMVSELPYFHVWFTLDGGYGHVVEDARRWPKGDLFAREIIGGMLDVGAEIVKRQGRWRKGDAEMEKRVQKFKTTWDKWDWTVALMEAQ